MEIPKWPNCAASLWPLWILIAPIAAVAIGQVLRADLRIQEFDAPSRLLAAGLIFSIYSRSNPDFRLRPSTAIGLGAVAGAIALYFAIDPTRTALQGGRLTTKLSWPNDLGAYSGVLLTFLTWILLIQKTTVPWKRALLLGAGGLGIIASIHVWWHAESRGPWVATVLSLLILLSIQGVRLYGLKRLITFWACAGVLIAMTMAVKDLSPRLTSIVNEPVRWLESRKENSSAGERLSMIVASGKLISMEPWTGYGDFGYLKAGCNDEFKLTKYYSRSLCAGSGPHNEVLARGLQSGIWGLLATLNLLLVPIVWFGFHLRKFWNSPDIYNPALLGLTFSINIALVCMFMEPYSIKFTATFNALVLAVLFGEVVAAKRMLDHNGLKS